LTKVQQRKYWGCIMHQSGDLEGVQNIRVSARGNGNSTKW